MEIKIVIDDRIVLFFKKNLTWRRVLAGASLAAMVPLMMLASDTNNYGLFVFEPNTVISSSEVNQNFEKLGEHVDAFESAITIDGARNVGIGTTDPMANLDVEGNLSRALSGIVGVVSGQTQVTGAGTKFTEELSIGDAIRIGDEVFTVAGISSDTQLTLDSAHQTGANNVVAYSDGDLLAVRNGAGEGKVVVDQSGNVGIGTTGPWARLHVGNMISNGTLVTLLDSTGLSMTDHQGIVNDPFGMSIYHAGTNGVFAGLKIINSKSDYWNNNGGSLTQFQYNSGSQSVPVYSTALAIDRTGNVGIGTTAPGAKLGVVCSGNCDPLRLAYEGGSSFRLGPGVGGDINKFGWYDDAAKALRLVMDSTGNVGIGTTSPQQRLHVAGDVIADDYLYNSDRRLKTDIVPLANALEGVQCLQAVTYRWRDPSKSQNLQLGLIAQEVEACFPEVVSTDESGYKSVAYARMVAPLAEAVKAQQGMISTQQQLITDQKQALSRQQIRIATLDARMARLEALLNAGQ